MDLGFIFLLLATISLISIETVFYRYGRIVKSEEIDGQLVVTIRFLDSRKTTKVVFDGEDWYFYPSGIELIAMPNIQPLLDRELRKFLWKRRT